jgi:hypothetical protein
MKLTAQACSLILFFSVSSWAEAPYTGGSSDGYSSSTGYFTGLYFGGSYDGHAMSSGSVSDTDGDGLTDLLENLTGSRTLYDDADSDDDGIPDGVEDTNQNGVVDAGETDPWLVDSDGDGIQDGTEMGLTLADVGPDTDLAVFIPDSDPTTTTNPLVAEDTEPRDPNTRKASAMPWIPLLLLDN